MKSLINISGKIVFSFFVFNVFMSACAPAKGPAVSLVVSDKLLSQGVSGEQGMQIAVLPVENLSDTKAPIKIIGQTLKDSLKNEGLNILSDEGLKAFMEKQRLRYTGMIDQPTARAFKREIGTDAVLITSLELYNEQYPPKIALMSRLVSTGDKLEILWMDSAAMTGDDSPGILGLGLIEDPRALLDRAVKKLSSSLIAFLRGSKDRILERRKREKIRPEVVFSFQNDESSHISKDNVRKEKQQPEIEYLKFDPKLYYRSPILSPDVTYRIAVVPFLNKSERKNAGEIMMLNLVDQLRTSPHFNVIEPGIIREDFLSHRVILREGVSFPNADVIFVTLGDADLILSGTVLDYQDYQGPEGNPVVDFSIEIIERESREVVFMSKSHDRGNEGVVFFDHGKINTAHTLSSEMIRAVVDLIID
jgi:hypothetical protein